MIASSPDTPPGSLSPIIRAASISFGYSNELRTRILKDWSAEFMPGSMTSITGPSGRGKSTLLYLLGLMLIPSEGEIFFDGQSMSRMPEHARASLRAREFGFVFQDAVLDQTRSVLDNVTEAALYRNDDLGAARVRARDLLDEFDINVPGDRKPGRVSGGQAQRIALCRALLGEPRVVLADEPTGNLDPASARTVMDGLRRQAQRGAAVVIVTHSREMAEVCDKEIRL